MGMMMMMMMMQRRMEAMKVMQSEEKRAQESPRWRKNATGKYVARKVAWSALLRRRGAASNEPRAPTPNPIWVRVENVLYYLQIYLQI